MSSVPLSKREDALHQFETGRIKHLQEERLHIQKKTFTKWMNSFLSKARLEVRDLFLDLADGKMLLRLLEIISGEKLGKPNNGKMRVHKVENVNKSLAFLHTKVRLESIGAEDIVDGNPRLILGLIWTIILRFQIQEIEIKLDEENESSEKKSAKDALLLWCQRKTAGYKGIHIVDFTTSWRNGLGFNALIHAHRPDLIDYNSLEFKSNVESLNNAFTVANVELGIARILDAEDVDTSKPDEKSIITYVASYYHTFARMRDEVKGSRRIANIMTQMKDVDDSKAKYEKIMSSLLEWIRKQIVKLDDREFPNSLDGIQGLLMKFKIYRTEEKPPKYKERSEVEALFFAINASQKELNQPCYTPKDGLLVHDLETEWQKLEKAEHSREVALREELLRQERLLHLAFKFEKKSVLRKGYLEEMIQVLSDPRYGSNLAQVDATVKKHEAISADILSREDRFKDLGKMADELESENYNEKDKIREKQFDILEKWEVLLALLKKHQHSLSQCSKFMALLREADTVHGTITELESSFKSDDVGYHLLAVEDYLQKHALMESQVISIGDTIKRLNKQADSFADSDHKDAPLLQKKMQELNEKYQALLKRAAERKNLLDEARNLYQFKADMEEEDAWVVEKQRICQAGVTAKDLRAVISLQQKHKALEDEIKARKPKSQKIMNYGEALLDSNHPHSPSIRERIKNLCRDWEDLEKFSAERKKHLENASEAYSFYADANEADSWIKEKLPLVESCDYGEDETSARALLQRNTHIEEEIQAYQGDIAAINDQGQKLVKSGISSLNLSTQQPSLEEENSPAEPEFEWTEEVQLVPQEVWEEVPIERVEEKVVMEEKLMNTVIGRYPFEGQGMAMKKGEVMFLINKTNNDWWNVRKATGEEGFVPANYVRDGEPKTVRVRVKRPVTFREMQKVKKTKMVKQSVPVKKMIPKAPPRSKRPHEDCETVEKRLKTINDSYDLLLSLAKQRHHFLEESILLFAFFHKCSDFEAWMREQERLLKANDNLDRGENADWKFEKFLTDMSAAGKQVDNINALVDDFIAMGHSQLDRARARQKQIHDQWAHLNRLKQQKERSLEGASSVELFHRTCSEARDWMIEKMDKLDTDELGRDLKTVQSLQRKHDQLERELAPIEEKVSRVTHLGNSVKSSYPNETKNVKEQQEEIENLWLKLKGKACDRRNRLEEAVGKQIFLNSAKNLLVWVGDVKNALNADEAAKDVATAEQLLKAHQDLGDDTKAHQDEFNELNQLGRKLLKRNPNFVDVKEKLDLLNEEQKAIHRGYEEKGDWLRQCMDLQLFNREADQIDAATGSHETFLEFSELGDTLDGVEALLKRHDDFENTLLAQDDRLKGFSEVADKLMLAKHYDAKYISNRRNQVQDRRNAVKNMSNARRKLLNASLAYQQFKADASDFERWMEDKMKMASDESYKDLNNLERKLQKHEAFQREILANEGQLRRLNKAGEDLIGMNHYRSDDIHETLKDLNNKWDLLQRKMQERGHKMRQAAEQCNFNKTLNETEKSLSSLETELENTDVGSDLRSCKELLNKQHGLENEMSIMEKKINEMRSTGRSMAEELHFDSENIVVASKKFSDRFEKLKAPAALRRAALEESLRFHEFNFQIEAELQWIKEHMPSATSEVFGQNLHEAQNLQKKHKKLEAELKGHKPHVDKILDRGLKLIEESHPEEKQVATLCDALKDGWYELELSAAERNRKLELNLKVQQYFFEVSEVESWMAEKRNLLETKDYGKDEDIARKMLAKHKALELEIDTYSSIIKEIGSTADQMVRTQHPESRLIKDRQQMINQDMKELQKLSAHLRTKLMESMYRHEYFREAEELEKWIREQMITATSDDFGQDYEHLLLLQAKFEDFKHKVDAGAERFNQCDELAKKLISNKSPYSADIEEKQEMLGSAWENLLDEINRRDQKLEAAGEIHRFNRDVAEALSRIQEKFQSIPDDLGKDVHSVQSLLRRHEGFENDLVALEAQLQVLVDDSAKLQVAYPGSNAEHIAEQQTVVIENWNTLQEKTSQRKEVLLAAVELQRFLADSRDLMSWSSDLRAAMKAHEKVRDAASAQSLKTDHERIKAEIEAREDTFSKVVEAGRFMIEDEHYATMEIEDRVGKVLEERNQLHAAWQNKKVYLDQLIDLQFFLRDAKQIDSISASQEAALIAGDLGTTIEEVDALVKKHDAFEKLVFAQDEKLVTLKSHGAKLIEQNHFYSPNIKSRIDEVSARRMKVKELTRARNQQLSDALLYAQFNRDASDVSMWISEKAAYLEAEKQKGEVTSFEDKVKKLQKHQAFNAELQAHETMVKDITDKGTLLLKKKHKLSSHIKQDVDDVIQHWTELVLAAESYSRGLEEAQDILEFNTQVEKVDAWIRDKELMVNARDLGKDYEHCMALHRRLDDVDSDMRVDDKRFIKINTLADKIISQGRGDNKAVQSRRTELNEKWTGLKGAIENYREELAAALEIHAFNRDVDDTKSRIGEKAVILSSEDTGKNLAQVEALQRKQGTILRDMTAIEKKLREHEQEAFQLSRKYPHQKDSIQEKLKEVQLAWENLCKKSASRKNQLSDSFTMHKFRAELKELEKWGEDITGCMNAAPLPINTSEADMLIQRHQERKAEIHGRKAGFSKLSAFAKNIIEKEHSSCEAVQQDLETLNSVQDKVLTCWDKRKDLLTQAHQYQVFLELIEQADAWLTSKEAFLNNDDLGDTMPSVEALIRKHQNFEKTLEAQGNTIDKLFEYGAELVSNEHYNKEAILQHLKNVTKRRTNLLLASKTRAKKLEDSKLLQQFLRNVYEVEGWISEKLQMASDESYRDPINLQSKMQKHTAFEAELFANSGRITAVMQEGKDLVDSEHFAEQEIKTRLVGLEFLWKQLHELTQLKKGRLSEAYQALMFQRTLDDLDGWMDEVETRLQSEDHGHDLTSVQNLLKNHQLLEADIQAHQNDIEQAREVGLSLAHADHFLQEEILEKVENVTKRYDSLHEPMHIRKENLEDALLLQQFLRDIKDELLWIDEKDTLANSSDLGTSLAAVQNLQKKHKALEAEIHSHDPVITSINARAQQMIRSGHFASLEIDEKNKELQSSLAALKDSVSVRRLRLQDAVESQTFYSEANEAEAWMNERGPLLLSPDLGKDEDSVDILIKKMDHLHRDLNGFSATLERLKQLSTKLINRGHFDSDNIEKKMFEVNQHYGKLLNLQAARMRSLESSRQLYQFLRECEGVVEWLNAQMSIAASEDYGRDVEHVEILTQRFESFMSSLTSNEDKIGHIKSEASDLLEAKHPNSEKIQEKVVELQQLWDDLREVSGARQEALTGAKQVHVFDRNADETISWIGEKEAVISSEDYGHDLDTIQGLARRHQGFERDLAAVKEQVESVVAEAKRLAELFPDAREHISVKHEETVEAWNDLLEKSAQRKDKLSQAEKLQSYFDEYRDLMAWLNEILAKITSPELAKDVPGSEVLISRHKEYRTEIDTRLDAFEKFSNSGKIIVEQKHFMSDEIMEKIAILEGRKTQLLDIWQARDTIYHNNLDLRMFLRDAHMIESWIESRESTVLDDFVGASIEEVEELVRKHDDFLKTIDAHQDKLEPINRLTLLEVQFQELKKKEEDARKAEAARKEQEKMEAMKQKEKQRITDERRREDERRRTQEIKFTKEEMDRARLTVNGEYKSPLSKENDLNRKSMDVGDLSGLARSGSQTSLSSHRRGNTSAWQSLALPAASSPVEVKRAESMRIDAKKPRRTPSFNTRRRTQSFRRQKGLENMENLPPVEMNGYLERKQELQTGGKRATIRSWKTFYTVLCGQLLCFFKDERDFGDQKAASSPIYIFEARVEKADDYTKRKNVFRITTKDLAEYLFLAESDMQLEEWVTKLTFHAQLPPSMQLMSYDNHKDPQGEGGFERMGVPSRDSDNSSGHSTPEMARHHAFISSDPKGAGGSLDLTRPHSQSLDNPLYANLEHMQEASRPPVPPRSGAVGAVAQASIEEESPVYQNRISAMSSFDAHSPENTHGGLPAERTNGHQQDPSGASNGDGSPHQEESADGLPSARQPYTDHSRTASLPQGSSLSGQPYHAPSVHRHSSGASYDRVGGVSSETSSDGEPSKERRKGSVFKFFGRRKGAQV